MVEFTFLEVHLEESDFTANAPYSYGEKDVEAGEGPPPESDESRKGTALAAVVGLVFLAVVAFLAKRRYLDDEADDEFEFDE